MSTWGYDFNDPELQDLKSGRVPHKKSFDKPVTMTKNQKLIILRGLNAKASRLRELTREHYNAEGWDIEGHRVAAFLLINEMTDIIDVLRNELT